MAIGTLTLEKLQELLAERDKLLQEVEDLKNATIKSLWLSVLDSLERKLDDLEQNEEQIEMERKKILGKAKITRPVLKNPRKNNKKASEKESAEVAEPHEILNNSVPETDNIAENEKVKSKAAPRKKAPARKTTDSDDGDDDDDYGGIAGLRQRLASYNLDSSPDHAEDVETEVIKKNKEPSKKAAAQKKKLSVSMTFDDEDEIEIIEDDDFEPEGNKKKAGKKAAIGKAAPKPPAGTKKRGPVSKQSQVLGQKLITEVLKPAESSPDKKVRKMRASPFNKKSSSVLGREITMETEETSPEHENSVSSLTAVAPRARPQRTNRGKQTYFISDDSESDTTDDSESDLHCDFNNDED